MAFKNSALKTCARKLLANETFHILDSSLAIAQHKSYSHMNFFSQEWQNQDSRLRKMKFFVTIGNTLNEYMISQFR